MTVKMGESLPPTKKQRDESLIYADSTRGTYVIFKFFTGLLRRRLGAISLLLAASAFGGCASYTPQPLDPGTALADLERVTLTKINHVAGAEAAPNQPALDLRDGLNPDEAALAAVLLSPVLREQLAAQGMVAGELLEAGLWPNPELDLDWRQAAQGSGKSLDVSLSIELLRWEERRASVARAEAKQVVARQTLLAASVEVALEARTRWWETVAARERLRLNGEEMALAEKLIKSLQAKQAVGAATALELNLAVLDKVQVQLDGLQKQQELATAERSLRAALGLPPNAELTLQIPEQPFAVSALRESYHEALPRLLESPVLKAAEGEYQVAEQDLRAAVARQYPGLRAGPAASLEYDGSWTTLLGAVLNFELPLFNRNQGEIAVMTAARDRQRAAYEAQLHRLRANLAEVDGALASSRTRLTFIDSEVLPSARESLRLAEVAYARGTADLLEILKAQSAAIAINRQVLEAQIADRLLLEAFQQALGQPGTWVGPAPPASNPDLADDPPPVQP